MASLRSLVKRVLDIDEQSELKVLFLSIAFCLIIGSYTIAREIKSAVFISIVGKEYIPYARFLPMFVLMPAILLYTRLVDIFRRYQVLSYCATFFGLLGLVFSYFISHPTIGLANTDASPSRIFGWLFYFYVEGFSPFLVSVIWAFANSISSPLEAKKHYGLLVAGSKLGGIVSAAIAWGLFSMQSSTWYQWGGDVFVHQLVLIISSLMLLLIPLVLKMLMIKVPGRYLHGYEAAYQAEKQKSKGEKEVRPSLFSGLFMMMRYPYVLGIFSIVFFYEIIDTVLSYLRLSVAQSNGASLGDVSAFLFETALTAHLVGLAVSLFGTKVLLDKLGERVCLILVPLVIGGLILNFLITASPWSFKFLLASLKAIHYAFSQPVRESLYIPTVKEIKFKSKAWIDAFGGKFGRSAGSSFNMVSIWLGNTLLLPLHSFFFAGIIGLWFIAALLLGRRFDRAVARNEVIGLENSQS